MGSKKHIILAKIVWVLIVSIYSFFLLVIPNLWRCSKGLHVLHFDFNKTQVEILKTDILLNWLFCSSSIPSQDLAGAHCWLWWLDIKTLDCVLQVGEMPLSLHLPELTQLLMISFMNSMWSSSPGEGSLSTLPIAVAHAVRIWGTRDLKTKLFVF